ncbi:MAG TPA: glycosyltransferase family 4 protein [Deltaproteobacteria bacterium]|nr:glycosyltransferase family 4 protein [Deltaproteobacteria bacterium]HOM29789.1 glycosyltransferase family 4 protein [Deltaproteobacteria bacterium]HPP81329.1 glycosyltransferase family 4 protein [Deltaproteobacteria bacterium]
MRVAVLSPIAWRTPPRHYGPWEQVASLLAEGLVRRGFDVTLFATGDSVTSARLVSVCPRGYEEDKTLIPKVWEALHIAALFERAHEFDLIHNHFDFLPLTYLCATKTPVLTTIHGFSSEGILPVYRAYNGRAHYVSISNADRREGLDYLATVYHGIDLGQFTFRQAHGGYLLFFGRIHHDKGARECIEAASRAGMKLVMAGIVQDREYFERHVKPHVDGRRVVFVGSADPRTRDELLGKAYALLHPINFDEPFGLSVVEAMACGTPVIAFNRGSMPEIVRHGVTGFLVRDVDAMVDAVPRVRDLDRAQARRWVEERFSAERMVDDYARLYELIVSRGR